MADVQTLQYRIGLVASQFVLGVRTVTNGLNRIGETVREQQKEFAKFAKTSTKTLDGIYKATERARKSVLALSAAMTGFLGAGATIGVRFNAQMEQAAMGFETMLGSAEQARKFLGELADFAKRTPFEMRGLISASQRLLAFGFQADQILTTLEAVGDAAAALGGGPDLINQIVRALGQIRAKGKPQAEEMLQLAEAGIPAWEILAEYLGVTIPEAMNMVTRGLVSADEAIEALTTGMSRRFGGLMIRQSRTFLGIWNRIRDTVEQVLGRAFRPLFDELRDGIEDLADFTESSEFALWANRIGDAMALVVRWIRQAVDWFRSLDSQTRDQITMWAMLVPAVIAGVSAFGLIASVASVVIKALSMITSAITLFISPWVLGTALIVTSIGALYHAWDQNMFGIRDVTERVWNAIKDIWETITESFDVVWRWTAEKAGEAWDWLSGPAWEWVKDKAWPTLVESFTTAWEWTAEKAGRAWDWLSGPAWEWIRDKAWPTLIDSFQTTWNWVAEKAGEAWDWLTGPAWDWVKDKAWPTLTESIRTAWQWVADRAGDAWDWLSGPAWTWIKDTAWPTLIESIDTAWEWTAEKSGQAWDWVENTLIPWVKSEFWPTLTKGAATVWKWAAEKAGQAWDWVANELIPWITGPVWESLSAGFTTVWKWTAEKGGQAWEWVTDTLIPWVSGPLWEKLSAGFETAWKWTAEFAGDVWQWLKEVAWPHINGVVETTWNWAIEIGGEIYQAIRKGLDTGDWSDLFVVSADVWRTGVKLFVSLGLAVGTVSALIRSIQSALGMTAVGLGTIGALGGTLGGALGALGVPGAIGAITIAVALAEAKGTGNFRKFGEDLALALAAGLAVYGITRNPQLGAYTFTIVMTWELGSRTADWFRGMFSTGEAEPFRVSDAAAAAPLEVWQERLAQVNEELRWFVETMGYAVELMSEDEIADVAFKLGAEDVWKYRQQILGYIQEYRLAELDQLAIEGRLLANLGLEIPESMRASARLGDLASDAVDMTQQVVDAIIKAYPYHERHRDVLMEVATGYRDVAEAIGAPLGIEELYEIMSLVLSESSTVLGNIEAMQNPARVTAAGFDELRRHGIELVHSTEGMLRNLEASLRLFRLYKAEFGAPDLAAGAYLFPGFARRGEWDRPFTGAADVRGMTAGEKARRFDEIYRSIIGAVGMEHGGIVPPGPPGDWFPAVLASDEAVIPKRIWQGGLVAIGKWFRSQGVPGFQRGLPPDIGDLNIRISEQRSFLENLGNMLTGIWERFVDGLMFAIDLLVNVIEGIARAILGEEGYEQLSGFILDIREKIGEFLNVFRSEREEIEDTDRIDAESELAVTEAGQRTRWERFMTWLRGTWEGAISFVKGGWRNLWATFDEETGELIGGLRKSLQNGWSFVLGRIDQMLDFLEGGWRDWILNSWAQFNEQGELVGGLKRNLTDLGYSVVNLLNPMNLLSTIVERLGWAAALLEGFLRPLSSIIERLRHPFQLLGEILGHLFVPLIEALYPLLQGLAWVVSWVAEIIAQAWNALASAINYLLGRLGIRLGLIDVDAIRKARGQLGEPPSAGDTERRRASPAFAELAGPTRSLLVELLRPLTSLNVLQGIGERMSGYLADIRDMLAQGIRIQGLVMPDIQAAAVGAMESLALAVPGAGPWLTVEGDLNINVDDPTDPNQILDAVSRLLGKQVRVQRRGKWGRDER